MIWKKLCFFILFFVLSPSIHSQEKEKTFLSDLYLEMNTGLYRIKYHSSLGSPPEQQYELRKENFLNIETSLKYRNDYYKIAVGTTFTGLFDTFTNAFGTIGVNVLGFLSAPKDYYFGPFAQIGLHTGKSQMFESTKSSSKIGLETYIKNIHFSIYFSNYNFFDKELKDFHSYYDHKLYSYVPVRSFGFDLGYSIPFKRKNSKK